MGAPKGNRYWKNRSKHGRDKIIQNPQILADASDEYFEHCLNNPIIQYDYKGKDCQKVEYELPKSFQKNELARWCGVAKWETINALKTDINGVERKDFMEVITRIEGIIADQKYMYAVVNVFNSNIVARDLGLTEKKEVVKKKDFINEDEITDRIEQLRTKLDE